MLRLLTSVLFIASIACENVSSQTPVQSCAAAGPLVRLQGVPEASGAAASRRHPDVLWTHNDSGDPVLFAFDARGKAVGRVSVAGAGVADWEDVAVGPCSQGTCLYIADVGDNNRKRQQITVYRVPEPALDAQATQAAESITLTYPDGARDAEAIFIARDSLFLVSKTPAATTALYRAPLGARSAALAAVMRLPIDRVTGAAISPDGAWVALRTNDELVMYRTNELTGGRAEPRRFPLTAFREPQGEGVAISADGVIYLVGEGGGGGGTLISVRCQLP